MSANYEIIRSMFRASMFVRAEERRTYRSCTVPKIAAVCNDSCYCEHFMGTLKNRRATEHYTAIQWLGCHVFPFLFYCCYMDSLLIQNKLNEKLNWYTGC